MDGRATPAPEAVAESVVAEAKIDIPVGRVIRFAVSGVLFMLVLLIELPVWIELLLYGSAYLLAGAEVIFRALSGFLRREFFTENSLMTLSSVGAWVIGEVPEAVAVMIFFQLGDLCQEMAENRARRSIRSVLELRPEFARIVGESGYTIVNPEDVSPGDIIQVRPGEKVPLDGVLHEGDAVVDTSALTGESLSRRYQAGDEILSGLFCEDGVISIEVTKSYKDSTVSRILALVEEAEERKTPAEGFISRFARRYTPSVFAAAALVFIVPSLITGNTAEWFYRALIFLVISCPCALVVSIPLSVFAGIGASSSRGILIKGGNYLDALSRAEIVVFDKTGTLTEGKFYLAKVKPSDGVSENQLIDWIAQAEAGSNHPLALVIREQRPGLPPPESFREFRGLGVEARLPDGVALVGSLKLLQERGVQRLPDEVDLVSISTSMHVSIDGIYVGYVELRDRIKEDSVDAITRLKALGVTRLILLTGDTSVSAVPVASRLGIDEVESSLLPNEKVDALERLQTESTQGGTTIFVGDGINDTPVLSRADVGVAMGALGSDAAVEAADVVIMNDMPSRLADGISIARKVKQIIIQNTILTLTIKISVLLLGILGLASLWAAVFADVGAAVLAILNTLRITIFAGRMIK